MSKLVRGDQLPSNLRRDVLASYIYRWTSDNPARERAWRGIKGAPTIPLISDAQWLREHAFYVTDRGTLDKRKKNAEPAYLIETKSSHATKKSKRPSYDTSTGAGQKRLMQESSGLEYVPRETTSRLL